MMLKNIHALLLIRLNYVFCVDPASIMNEQGFVADEMIEGEMKLASEFDQKFRNQGMDWIHQGVQGNDQLSLGKGIHLFSNLRNVPETIQLLFDQYQASLQIEAKNTFDMEAVKHQLLGTYG